MGWGASLCFVPPSSPRARWQEQCLALLLAGWQCTDSGTWAAGWLPSSGGVSHLQTPHPGCPSVPPTRSPRDLGRAWGPTHCQADVLLAKPGRYPTLPPPLQPPF